MSKKLFLLVALGLFFTPALAKADVSARQDSCVADDAAGTLTVYFSVINFSLPASVCSFTFVPEPQPPLPECTMIACGSPVGWSCGLNGDGGATWSAVGPAACISPGGILSDFSYTLDPGFCCYVVSFYDAAGDLLATQEECFCDKPVQAQSETWGGVKAIYR